ncbi:MAG: type IV secretion protein Rhs [Chitinophagaceae bacterium]|nr:MAG: type IV secretion protein Rhs [Chitinophagaceae bacterium]
MQVGQLAPPVYFKIPPMRPFLFICAVVLAASCHSGREDRFVLMDPSETGLLFSNEITETEDNNIMTYQYLYNGAGIAAGDLNNDGLPDLYFAGNSVPGKLFINKGQWKFEDVTATGKVGGRPGDWKTGVTMADVNGDGWLDLYLCYSGNSPGEGFQKPVLSNNTRRNNQLFINGGCKPGGIPVFTEQAAAYGLEATGTFSTQSYFFDYDRDGDLDMFLVNHANTFYSSLFNTRKLRNLRHPYFGNKLYRNDGGHFSEVSEAAGIHGSGLNYGLSAAISDLDGDGWPDIYVTNDYDEQDFLYLNNRDGTFREVSHQSIGHMSKYSMGSDFADINNDGRTDLFVADMLPEDNRRQKLLKGPDQFDKYSLAVDSGFHHQNMRNTLQVNSGTGQDSVPQFRETGQFAGVSNTDWSWAPLLADFDNDGYNDLFITNGYLHDYTNQDFLKFAQEKMGSQAPGTASSRNNWLELIRQMPSTGLTNYIMKNVDGQHFDNKTSEWGLTLKGVSNGAVYADFDNDGDLDLVINNLNEPVSVYQNKLTTGNNFIKIKLEGKTPNTTGTGARLEITAGSRHFIREAYPSRGYASSVEPVLTIGVGKADTLEEIRVTWSDGTESVLKSEAVNKTITVRQSGALAASAVPASGENFFTDLLLTSGIGFRHVENKFIDYNFQRLLPYQPSRLGARLAVGDVNKDGNDDVFFGGAIGQAGRLFLGGDDGSFITGPSQPWETDIASEDIGAVFFDADNDGDADLYVVSGGNEYGSGDPLYHDRLYVNDGNGTFTKNTTAIPVQETTSGSCVVPFDFDKDGDLDLFVGGRIAAQLYPMTPKSFLFRNDTRGSEIRFTNVTEQMNKDLQLAGMVTGATWTDLDKDGWTDLLLVGEWMPVRVFHNDQGKTFTEITHATGLAGTEGWWTSIFAADLDNDGDIDFLLGNAGLNQQFHASRDLPLEYVVQDINGDGVADPILCYSIQGKMYPAPSMDELLEQVPGLRKKFYRYENYADAQIEDLMDKSLLDQAYRLKMYTLQSSWIENTVGGKLVLKPLPPEVQVSMVNAFVMDDFDGDNQKEVLCAGNFYPYKVEWGKSDAFAGAMLKFSKGRAEIYKPGVPLRLDGDIRDLGIVNNRSGNKRVLVSRDNDKPAVFGKTKK